jgi:hypothetical protein
MRPAASASLLVATVTAVVAAAVAVTPVARAADEVPWAPASTATIHPGIITDTQGSRCTSNFVFSDAAGHVYLGQAAHCSRGDRLKSDGPVPTRETGGCTYGSRPLGTEVRLGDSGITGTLAYSSYRTMQTAIATRKDVPNAAACKYNDFALVRIPDSARGLVNPSLPYFGGPTGLRRPPVAIGEQVVSFGNSPTRQGIAPLGVKQGEVVSLQDGGWGYVVLTATPGIPGDSGSAMLDSTGQALGIVVTLSLEPPGANGVTDAALALDYAKRTSGIRGLVMRKGTESFAGPSVAAALLPPSLRPAQPAGLAPARPNRSPHSTR